VKYDTPLFGKFLPRPLGFRKTKLRTKFEVPSSNSSEDILDRLPKNLGVMWFKPRPFLGKLLVRPLGFPKTKLYVPNLKSVSQVVLKLCSIVCQKN